MPRDELEELTTAAVKEEQIEVKLNGIESDWAALNLVFAGGLGRGESLCGWVGQGGIIHHACPMFPMT